MIRTFWLRFQHHMLMDRAANLERLRRESAREHDECMHQAAQIRRELNVEAHRRALGLRKGMV